MSEPTLYRYRTYDEDVDFGRDEFMVGVWMRPVERCGHRDEAFPNGHIEKHIITQYVGQGRHRDDIEWCPGAGIGDDDGES